MQRINVSQVETSERFYQFPKMLLEDEFYSEMTLEAKMLYTIMKDRHLLSLKNKWVDDQGDVYIIFTNKQAAEKLGCGESKAKKVRAELIKFGLIEVVSPNGMVKRASHIYVGNLVKKTQETALDSKGQNVTFGKVGIHPIEESEYDRSNGREMTASDTELKDTELSNTEIAFDFDDDEERNQLNKKANQQNEKIRKNATVTYISNYFTEKTGVTPNPAQTQIITEWVDVEYDIDVILEAISKSAINGSSNLKYIQKTILTKRQELQNAIDKRLLGG